MFFAMASHAAQAQDISQLRAELEQDDTPLHRSKVLFELASAYSRESDRVDSALFFLDLADSLARAERLQVSHARCQDLRGSIYRYQGDFMSAITYHLQAVRESDLLDKCLRADFINNLAVDFRRIDDYEKSLELHLQAVELALQCQNDDLYGKATNSIGNVYLEIGQYEKALEYFQSGLQIDQKGGDSVGIAINLNNIGLAYRYLGQTDMALAHLARSYEINSQMGNDKGMNICLVDIGKLHFAEGRHSLALENFERAYESTQGDKSSQHHAYAAVNRGMALAGLRRPDDAIRFLEEGILAAKASGGRALAAEGHDWLYRIYKEKGLPAEALAQFELATQLRDSILDQSKQRGITNLQIRHELQQQQYRIENLERESLQSSQDVDRLTTFNFWLIVLGAAVLAMAVVLFFGYRDKRLKNEQLLCQKIEIGHRAEELGRTGKRLSEALELLHSSVEYAQSIQKALLPEPETIARDFAELLIFQRPKDIVSGDFHWYANVHGIQVLAVGDCTGHGVPAGFLTVVGSMLLNEVVITDGIFKTNFILEKLNHRIQELFGGPNTKEELRDGLDLGVFVLDSRSQIAEFCGAKIGLLQVRQTEGGPISKLVKGHRFPLGNPDMAPRAQFKSSAIKAMPGDRFYLFTDGIKDQFGGKENRKFMQTALVELLEETGALPMAAQAAALEQRMAQWQGDMPQTDDMLLVGVKI